jgi:hypothetical protein
MKKGSHHTIEAKKKMSDSQKGKVMPIETRLKISLSLKEHGEEISKRMSISQSGEDNSMFGKHHTEEAKQRISEAKVGKSLSPECRKKMSKNHFKGIGPDHYNYGKKRSPEQKEKISKKNTGRGNPFYGKKHSAETRLKMSLNHSQCSGEKNTNWQGGISFKPYCPKFNEDLRKRVRDFFNNQCILCGKSKDENGENLSVHHVEYNKNACCDGKLACFAALCHKCHTKTTKSYNRQSWENILHIIIDYLYDGKSYYTKSEYKI